MIEEITVTEIIKLMVAWAIVSLTIMMIAFPADFEPKQWIIYPWQILFMAICVEAWALNIIHKHIKIFW